MGTFHRRRYSISRIFIFISIFLIIYNEYLVYILTKCTWKSIKCRKGFNCTRMLFVADPQLLGLEYDKSIYSPIAIWDSDRFLYKTFQQALSFSEPEIIVYLGDLLDEGSIATPEQYERYVQRFYNIFSTPQSVRSVHLPGDNDIGGENGEYILNTNIRRFNIEFMRNDIFDLKNQIRFFKINSMTLDISNPDIETNSKRIRVGLSHMPILQPGGPLQRNVISLIDPHVLFTAHWHDSRIFIYPSTNSILFQDNIVKEYDLKALKEDHSYLEIMIPTSSYRMGKLLMGFGFATLENSMLDNSLNLRFSVYWSPQRFFYLAIYVVWIMFLSIYFLCRNCFSSFRSKLRIYTNLKKTYF